MRTMLKALAGAAVIAAIAALLPAQAKDMKEINFGIISTESSTNLKKRWEPFLEAMSKGTGLKINGFYASDYAGVIEGMRFNKVQVAWFGNQSAMEAVDRSGGEIFAQAVNLEGNPGYWSHLIVHKDSPIESLDDVLKCDKSIDFGIGDPNSTSGFLVPTTYAFATNDVDPKDCFKTVRNASHEANAMAVANKQVMVATNNSENLHRLEATRLEVRKNIKVIWTSPLIPSNPLVWRKDLNADIKAKLYTWIMTYGRTGTPEEVAAAREILKPLRLAPFRPSSNAQLYPIRQLELNKQVLKIKSDAKLSDADKKAKIAELQKEIQKVSALEEKVPSM